MPHFNAKPHEVRAMLGCDEFCIVRPLKPQPSVGFTVSRYAGEHTVEFDCDPPICAPEYIPLLFSPGDVVTVKEAFARVVTYKGPSESVVFRADSRDSSGAYWHEVAADPTGVKWSRPQNMRPEWSRLTLEVTSVSVKRVLSLSDEDAEACGLIDMRQFCDWWEGERTFPAWNDNPWVCIARAKVHHCNIAKVTSEEAA